ncbi:hypothetical protein [Nocardia abscessus]|nr:hypothetical protein [Nocardia abscessus]
MRIAGCPVRAGDLDRVWPAVAQARVGNWSVLAAVRSVSRR